MRTRAKSATVRLSPSPNMTTASTTGSTTEMIDESTNASSGGFVRLTLFVPAVEVVRRTGPTARRATSNRGPAASAPAAPARGRRR
ncbi:hypothetical protein ACFPM0_28730 [Pseudonocardia sulfidoxydans]|uniref:hypothetical protein n=1 Tax=Pseudonocardia sulfidoxydans TaxID=54011 RepID=UPI00361EECE9